MPQGRGNAYLGRGRWSGVERHRGNMDHVIETASLHVGQDHMDVALIDNAALGSEADRSLIGRL